jgi:hypothetical protein
VADRGVTFAQDAFSESQRPDGVSEQAGALHTPSGGLVPVPVAARVSGIRATRVAGLAISGVVGWSVDARRGLWVDLDDVIRTVSQGHHAIRG